VTVGSGGERLILSALALAVHVVDATDHGRGEAGHGQMGQMDRRRAPLYVLRPRPQQVAVILHLPELLLRSVRGVFARQINAEHDRD
jgi:hypothetical protein